MKEFCSVWAGKLSASDKSSYIYNQEMWLEEPSRKNRNAVSMSRLKIPAESLQDLEREDVGEYCEESWQPLKGRTIMSGETLVEKLDEAVCCRVFTWT